MRLKVLIFIFLLFSLHPTQASVSDFVGEDHSFRIKESADYTNHLDDTMLISVEGNKEVAYSLLDSGGTSDANFWLTGVFQEEIENDVSLGVLNYSGFDATSGGRKSAGVTAFNVTVLDPANYSTDMVELLVLPFVASQQINVTLVDNSTLPAIFIGLGHPNFILDPDSWIDVTETYFINHVSRIEQGTELTVGITSDARSFSYSVSGEVLDIHTFTYHNKPIRTLGDYNRIQVDGGFSLSYDADGVLTEYSLEYNINYESIRIMQYVFSITVGSGSIGNIQVGDAGFFPSINYMAALSSLLILVPIVSLSRRRR